MENVVDLKDRINRQFNAVILAMENSETPKSVHDKLVDIASFLNDLSKLSVVDKNRAISKAKMILATAKSIDEFKSYKSIYYDLTGKILKEPIQNQSANVSNVKDRPSKNLSDKKIKKKEVVSPYQYNWNTTPDISFKDVADLENVKEEVNKKVLLPLTHPELYLGYLKKNGGGLLLFGPPGTGKTMIAVAIAHEIGVKFCSIGPSDLLSTGYGNSEKAIAQLFKEARSFKCAIIFFDEIESICPVSIYSQYARQIRSELLHQIQGMDSYNTDMGNILYLIAATNKPWNIDPALVRPGRFGTRVYVDLPDKGAREYMVRNRLDNISKKRLIKVEAINVLAIVEATNGFNGADISYLLDEVQEHSIARSITTGIKNIVQDDFTTAFGKIKSSVQLADIKKLLEWKETNYVN